MPESTEKPNSRFHSVRVSPLRRAYYFRLAGRTLAFLYCCAAAYWDREQFLVLQGWNFFRRVTPLHVLWCVWVADMLMQVLPVCGSLPLGSQKVFQFRFRPSENGWDTQALRRYTEDSAKAARRVLAVWGVLLAVIWYLRYRSVLEDGKLFLISAAFYVCDLICVLIWCPFRLMLGNRCCTTCRIFNWDHLMMFSPVLPVRGFFTWSLVTLSILVWVLWERGVQKHPERFWERSNTALQCGNCTDKLCTQYCGKRNRKC